MMFNAVVLQLVVLAVCCLSQLDAFRPASTSTSAHTSFRPRGSLLSRWASMKYDVVSDGNYHSLSFEVAGKPMKFETGKIGRQASGAVLASTYDTTTYSTVCMEREPSPVDFTPLRVDYFARFSAVGQTIGAFHKRDSRGDDTEILVARLIDRPIRPMIAEGWQHETQVLTWVLSYDKQHSTEALSICSASAAMCVSAVPMVKPIAGVAVGYVDDKFIVNPTKAEMKNSTLELTVAGTKDGILMIEGASEFLSEEKMVEAIGLGHAAIGEICDAIAKFQEIAGKPKKLDTLKKLPSRLLDEIDAEFGEDLTAALSIGDKHARGKAVGGVEEKIMATFTQQKVADLETIVAEGDPDASLVDLEADPNDNAAGIADEDAGSVAEDAPGASMQKDIVAEDEASELNVGSKSSGSGTASGSTYGYDAIDIKMSMKKLLVRCLRRKILTSGVRSDGRTVDEVRPIDVETSILPMPHGSSLFTRGETQALATATLGSKDMEAKTETLDEFMSRRFYLQYRFPPSSVGEVGRVGGVNRREVGHGNLAERALMPCIPTAEKFPYSIRAESLITESCGSSSMATVCGCCLAMLDAGVPLKSIVAGVAMGLILGETEAEEPVILTDILGLEDALGTMDFKVAGDDKGITTFQLDIKSEGLTLAIIERALQQAKEGRLHVLNKMTSELSEPRKLKPNVPKILEFSIDPAAIGKVIGPKGKTVQTLIETHEVESINLDEDGTVQVVSKSYEKNEECKAAVIKIAGEVSDKDKGRKKEPEGPPPEEGMIYRDCRVVKLMNFGVFVEVSPGYEGLVHHSELGLKRMQTPEQAGFKEGDVLDVKFLGYNDKRQMRLSHRDVILRDTPKSATGQPANAPSALDAVRSAEQSMQELLSGE